MNYENAIQSEVRAREGGHIRTDHGLSELTAMYSQSGYVRREVRCAEHNHNTFIFSNVNAGAK